MPCYPLPPCTPGGDRLRAGERLSSRLLYLAEVRFNSLMVTVAKLLSEGLVHRVLVLDCDQHYGNGTDQIIAQLSMDGVVENATFGRWFSVPADASAYLSRLGQTVRQFGDFDLVLYQAGADVHVDDPLGGVLTTEQMIERDRTVFQAARELIRADSLESRWWLSNPPRRSGGVACKHDARVRPCLP